MLKYSWRTGLTLLLKRFFTLRTSLGRSIIITLLVTLVGVGGAASAYKGLALAILALLGFLAVILLLKATFWGMYALAIIYPFVALEYRGLPLAKIFALILLLIELVKYFISKPSIGTSRHFALPLFLPFLALTSAGVLSLINSILPGLSLFRLALQVGMMYVVVLIAYNAIRTPRQLVSIFWAMVIMGTFIALSGWYNYFSGSFQRVSAYYPRIAPPAILGGTHVAVAGTLVGVAPLAVALLVISTAKWHRGILLAILLLFALTIAFTLSRAGWICLGIEAGLLLWILRRRRIRLLLTAFVAASVALVSSGPMIALLGSYVRASSDTARAALTRLAVDLFVQHPIVGVGFGTYTIYNDVVFDSTFSPPLAVDAHGTLQKVMSETGVLGLVAISFLLFAILQELLDALRRTKRDQFWHPVLLSSLTSFFVSQIFELSSTRFYTLEIWFPIGIFLAASRLAREHSQDRAPKTSTDTLPSIN